MSDQDIANAESPDIGPVDPVACATPLVELLEDVPKDGRVIYEHHLTRHSNIPYGRLCHEAAERIAELEAQLKPTRARPGVEYFVPNGFVLVPVERIAELEAQLKWYGEQAKALNTYCETENSTGLEAVVVALALDGGKRAQQESSDGS
jgi:hypothetical protein